MRAHKKQLQGYNKEAPTCKWLKVFELVHSGGPGANSIKKLQV